MFRRNFPYELIQDSTAFCSAPSVLQSQRIKTPDTDRGVADGDEISDVERCVRRRVSIEFIFFGTTHPLYPTPTLPLPSLYPPSVLLCLRSDRRPPAPLARNNPLAQRRYLAVTGEMTQRICTEKEDVALLGIECSIPLVSPCGTRIEISLVALSQ
eukprot:COSAG02_NODE_30_length_50867_cov_66.594331_8_plen_156_part_00